MGDVYERLALFLDRLPAGFPASPGGAELRILRRLFAPDEASLFMCLSLLSESAGVVAYRARLPKAEVVSRLKEMAEKGLIASGAGRKGEPEYSVSQYVVGFLEDQVDRLDRELAELAEEYNPVFFKEGPWAKVPQIRTIPIGKSLPVERAVMPYERAEEIVRSHRSFAIRNCVCRQEKELLGEGCGKPLDVCLSFDGGAEASVRDGRARSVTMEEALGTLRRAEQAGLVLQPSNSQDPFFICACCGCCCGVLRGIKQFEKPADLVANAYFARHDPAQCSACGVCVQRCPMEALGWVEGSIALNSDRCIGCGLCVSACATGALGLERKAVAPAIPKNTVATYIQLAQARSRLGILRLAGMVAMSILHRLLAPR